MDFQTLTRRQLQALCKKNKIPANMTNVAMASSLNALDIVEGIEEILMDQSKCQSEQSNIETPIAPRTGCRSSVRRMPNKEGSVSTKIMTRAQRGAKIIAGEDKLNATLDVPKTPAGQLSQGEEKKGVPETPMATTARRLTRATRSSIRMGMESLVAGNQKVETSTKKVYSTRRNTRLLEKKMMELNLIGDDEIEPAKIQVASDSVVQLLDNEVTESQPIDEDVPSKVETQVIPSQGSEELEEDIQESKGDEDIQSKIQNAEASSHTLDVQHEKTEEVEDDVQGVEETEEDVHVSEIESYEVSDHSLNVEPNFEGLQEDIQESKGDEDILSKRMESEVSIQVMDVQLEEIEEDAHVSEMESYEVSDQSLNVDPNFEELKEDIQESKRDEDIVRKTLNVQPEETEEVEDDVQDIEITEEVEDDVQDIEITEEVEDDVQDIEITEEVEDDVQDIEITEEVEDDVQEIEETEDDVQKVEEIKEVEYDVKEIEETEVVEDDLQKVEENEEVEDDVQEIEIIEEVEDDVQEIEETEDDVQKVEDNVQEIEEVEDVQEIEETEEVEDGVQKVLVNVQEIEETEEVEADVQEIEETEEVDDDVQKVLVNVQEIEETEEVEADVQEIEETEEVDDDVQKVEEIEEVEDDVQKVKGTEVVEDSVQQEIEGTEEVEDDVQQEIEETEEDVHVTEMESYEVFDQTLNAEPDFEEAKDNVHQNGTKEVVADLQESKEDLVSKIENWDASSQNSNLQADGVEEVKDAVESHKRDEIQTDNITKELQENIDEVESKANEGLHVSMAQLENKFKNSLQLNDEIIEKGSDDLLTEERDGEKMIDIGYSFSKNQIEKSTSKPPPSLLSHLTAAGLVASVISPFKKPAATSGLESFHILDVNEEEKNNVNRNGMKLELITTDQVLLEKKNEVVMTKDYSICSLRQLKKEVKQIAAVNIKEKKNAALEQVANVARPALQVLSENQVVGATTEHEMMGN